MPVNKDELTETILRTLPSLVLFEAGYNDRTLARSIQEAIQPTISELEDDRDFWYERWRTAANNAITLQAVVDAQKELREAHENPTP